jgi:hypothetical protein
MREKAAGRKEATGGLSLRALKAAVNELSLAVLRHRSA